MSEHKDIESLRDIMENEYEPTTESQKDIHDKLSQVVTQFESKFDRRAEVEALARDLYSRKTFMKASDSFYDAELFFDARDEWRKNREENKDG